MDEEALELDLARDLAAEDASPPPPPAAEERVEERAEEASPEGAPRKRRRRRRKLISPAHEERIARYRALVEDRGWIFAPPSPARPVSALFEHLTDNQVESLSA